MRALIFIMLFSILGPAGFAQNTEKKGLSDIEASKMASLPVLKLTEGHSLKSLPTVKDNSTNEHFPEVFMQDGWSCNQASSVGYLFTYEMNAIRDLPASDQSNLYPPSYVWNFLNQGSGDTGVSYFDSWEVIRTNGIPSIEDYGEYPGPLAWPTGYDIYYQGMKNRTQEVYNIFVGDQEGLQTLKHWINDHMDGSPNGGLANFQIGSTGMKVQSIPDGMPGEGKFLMQFFNWRVGHAMTFVGWDDNIMYDFNGDGQYTNDIDTNGDGLVDMRDWEVGAMLAVNSWGRNWPAEHANGRVYVPYRLLALDSWQGGIWARSVTVMRPKKEYSPKLTIKAGISHTHRNQIKIVAGVAQNFASAEPEIILEYPFFNFLGGALPMQGWSGDGESIEIGLDITPLLNYINPDMPAKFFLQVYHRDQGEISGGGEIDYMSIMDYGSGSVVEEVSPQTNEKIKLRQISSISVIYDPVAVPVNISTSALPDAEVGNGYSHILSAEGGTPPYKWSNMADQYVAKVNDDDWSFPAGVKIPEIPDTSRVVIDLGYDFPFYGNTYNQITVLKNGGVIMGPYPKDYPYVIDPRVYMYQNPGIYPLFTELQYLFSSDGVYRYDEADGTTIAWDATLSNEGEVYDPKFGVKMFKDGRIETAYFPTSLKADWNWIAGVSAGDMKTYTLPEINNAPIFWGGIKVNYTLNDWPSWLFFSEGGAMLGVPEDGVSRVFLPVRVEDNTGLYMEKTFNLQINGTSSSENIQTDEGIEIYPNPFVNRINLELENIKAENISFDMFSVDGKNVYSKIIPAGSSHIELDLSELEGKGNYFYQIGAGSKIYQGKLVRIR